MSRVQPDPVSRVIPAHVRFLTIYNPALGDTDETERDQIVFWTSEDELGQSCEKSRSRSQEKSSDLQDNGQIKAKSEDEEYNERLRQIGLARGMVEFVKNFSNNKPVDTIETEKTRVVLHELENGWWILASIDLTKLPANITAATQKGGSSAAASSTNGSNETASKHEYSAREVAPCSILLAQLLRAHRIFLLHHATTLWDIYHKLGRPDFCSLLSRYWSRFFRNWDVLLHGNPATEVYGACTKLAGGGELGVGVGEEEWGSGEREVLEGFIARTEGLVDMVVGRYGMSPKKRETGDKTEETVDKDAWLGTGEDPGPADGVIFSGTNMLSRKSLATVSQWMEAIFKEGGDAYGVGENPSARPRAKRKTQQRPKQTRKVSDGPKHPKPKQEDEDRSSPETSPRYLSPRGRAPNLRRKAMENNATPPGIPAPLVGQVERSLDEAIARVADRSSSRSPKSSPKKEKSQEAAMKNAASNESTGNDTDSASSWFDKDKMAKVFTLGYGSSWTLSPSGLGDQETTRDLPKKVKERTESNNSNQPRKQGEERPQLVRKVSRPAEERLQELDPTPAFSDDEGTKPYVQQLEKTIGKFLIGLSGDLESAELNGDDDEAEDNSPTPSKAQRIYLRTLTIDLSRPLRRPSLVSAGRTVSQDSYASNRSGDSHGSAGPKTSAAASIDGPARVDSYSEKLRVAIYAHQPFIFVFIFELHTPSLTMPSFYRNIHYQLGPLQGPLLKRTDPQRVAERIKDVIISKDSNTTASTLAKTAAAGNVVFDLVFDPSKLTIRTSIPNIPIPASTSSQDMSSVGKMTTISGSWYTLGIPIGTTTPSASTAPRPGKSDQATRNKAAEQWTRIDALNVHGQVLNSWLATRPQSATSKSSLGSGSSMTAEIERTVKTNRGWWVLWMKVEAEQRPSAASSTSSTITQTVQNLDRPKEAFLVRKSTDAATTAGKITQKSGSSGRWLLREQSRDVSGGGSASTAEGTAVGARSISEGVGIDARRWVEGLLHLSQ